MTILQASLRLVRSLLSDPQYFWYLAALIILGDAVLTQLIIRFVSFTEIDWETYMIQAQIASKGELDYSNITGPTGPTVYPAGHLYIHRLLYDFTEGGTNIKMAQQMYGTLYLTLVTLVCAIYRRTASVPNWMLLMLPLSKRLHSIFVLRLFNDCWSVVAVHAAVLAYQYRGMELLATILFSIALSVKMSALLYLPGLLVILFKRLGPLRTVAHIATLVLVQLVIGRHYIRAYPWEYLHASFDFSRVFLYKWTVNWRFVHENTFLSSRWSKGLLLGHLTALVLFGSFRWCRGVDSVPAVLRRGFRRPTQPAGVAPITGDGMLSSILRFRPSDFIPPFQKWLRHCSLLTSSEFSSRGPCITSFTRGMRRRYPSYCAKLHITS
jgi:alpha-1,3-mannosyltransferase